MDKWIRIIEATEEMWKESREYQNSVELIADGGYNQYKIDRDSYKARRIFDLYGYDWFCRFVERCPHINHLFDEYVPCKQYSEQYQCTMFCHKYNFEKGCMLNATE